MEFGANYWNNLDLKKGKEESSNRAPIFIETYQCIIIVFYSIQYSIFFVLLFYSYRAGFYCRREFAFKIGGHRHLLNREVKNKLHLSPEKAHTPEVTIAGLLFFPYTSVQNEMEGTATRATPSDFSIPALPRSRPRPEARQTRRV